MEGLDCISLDRSVRSNLVVKCESSHQERAKSTPSAASTMWQKEWAGSVA